MQIKNTKNRADLFGMGSADNWVLLSNVMDRTYIRNKITYEMAIAAGLQGSPQSRYIDLYINNRYHGMYQLCEKVEIDTQRVPITDLGEQNRKLNKNIEVCEGFETEGKKGVILPIEPKEVTGGYLLERDVPEKFDKEISGFQTQVLGDFYTIKNPKYASYAQVDYISALVGDMEKAVVEKDGISPDTGRSYLDYIDLESFAKKYVVEELSKNQGGGASSSFFYKPDDAVSTKLLAGPVWDYDKAYARQSGMDGSTRDLCYLTQRFNSTVFFWHLYSHPEFQEMVSTCYAEFFSDYIQLVEEEKIDAYLAQIHAAADMDSVRWKSIYGDTADWTKEVGKVRSFLLGRKAFLDEVWIGQKELRTVHFVAEDFLRDSYMSVIRGEALQSVPIGEPGEHMADLEFDGWFLEDGTPFDMTQPVCEDITVYGRGHIRTDQEP